MTDTPPAPQPIEAPQSQDAKLQALGIRRVPVDTYHVGAYRYSNLADAIAQAERVQQKTKS
jgi:hypothetical protein